MAIGVNGENILLALRRVANVEGKQEFVPVIILSRLEEENNAQDHHQSQGSVTFEHVQVLILLISL